MKKKWLFAIFLTLLLCVNVMSEDNSKHWLFVHSGISFPMSPESFKDGYKEACDIGGGYGFNLSPKISLVVNLNYKQFQSKEKYWMYINDDNENMYYKASILSIFCDLRYNLNRKRLSPYLLAGAGLTVIDRLGGLLYMAIASPQIDGRTVNFCMGGGFGLTYKINSKWNVFIESRYTTIYFFEEEGNYAGYLPICLGFSLDI